MTGTSSDNAQSLDARSKGTDGGYSSSGLSDIDRLHHRRQGSAAGASSDVVGSVSACSQGPCCQAEET